MRIEVEIGANARSDIFWGMNFTPGQTMFDFLGVRAVAMRKQPTFPSYKVFRMQVAARARREYFLPVYRDKKLIGQLAELSVSD